MSFISDQVRFVRWDFPVITAFSPEAVQAARCAYDQGQFWEYHDLLFEQAVSLRVRDLKSSNSMILRVKCRMFSF